MAPLLPPGQPLIDTSFTPLGTIALNPLSQMGSRYTPPGHGYNKSRGLMALARDRFVNEVVNQAVS